MEKDQNINLKIKTEDIWRDESWRTNQEDQEDSENNEEEKEVTPEEKIKELEDKVARTFAEMENQRRRFEKEKDDAFDYGGFAFAKEALNLIDNLRKIKTNFRKWWSLKRYWSFKKNFRTFWYYK